MAHEETELNVSGHAGRRVANTFFHQAEPTPSLAVVLPGARYHARMPLLYYLVAGLVDSGHDVLTVDYDDCDPTRLSRAEERASFIADIRAVLAAALARRAYGRLTLVGKSLGTRVLAELLGDPDGVAAGATSLDLRTVWLTPAWADADAAAAMVGGVTPALHVIGTSDPYFSRERQRDLERRPATQVMAVAGADHSLDVAGDAAASLVALQQVCAAVRAFVGPARRAVVGERFELGAASERLDVGSGGGGSSGGANVVLRRATAADVAAVVQLGHDGAPPGQPRPPLPSPLPAEYGAAFRAIDGDPAHNLMVAEADGLVVGTIHLTYLTYLSGMGRTDCQVESVHVAEAWRGRGVGSGMMRWVIAEATRRNCRRVQLTTNKTRQDAHRFYRRLGFVLSHEGAKLVLG